MDLKAVKNENVPFFPNSFKTKLLLKSACLFFNIKLKIKAGINTEKRANRFAASLLMPKESFKEAYSELSNNIDDKNIIVQGLSDAFNAPKTAVRIRMKEVLNV